MKKLLLSVCLLSLVAVPAITYATCQDSDGYKCYPKDDYSRSPQGDCLEMACEHGCVENEEFDGRCCEAPKEGADCRTEVYKDGCLIEAKKVCLDNQICNAEGKCITCHADETVPANACYDAVNHPAVGDCPAYTTYTTKACTCSAGYSTTACASELTEVAQETLADGTKCYKCASCPKPLPNTGELCDDTCGCRGDLVCSAEGICVGCDAEDGEYLTDCQVCFMGQKFNIDAYMSKLNEKNIVNEYANYLRAQKDRLDREHNEEPQMPEHHKGDIGSGTMENENDNDNSQISDKIEELKKEAQKKRHEQLLRCEICKPDHRTGITSLVKNYNEKCQICQNGYPVNKYNSCQSCDENGNITDIADGSLNACNNCVDGKIIPIYSDRTVVCGDQCCATGSVCIDGVCQPEKCTVNGVEYNRNQTIELYSYKELASHAARNIGIYDVTGGTIGPFDCNFKVIMPWWSVDDNVCIQGDGIACQEPATVLNKWHTVCPSTSPACGTNSNNHFAITSPQSVYVLPAGKQIKFKMINKAKAADGGPDSSLSVSIKLEPISSSVTEACGPDWFTSIPSGSCRSLVSCPSTKQKKLGTQICCTEEGMNKLIQSTENVDFSADGWGCCPVHRWYKLEDKDYCCPSGTIATDDGCCPSKDVYLTGAVTSDEYIVGSGYKKCRSQKTTYYKEN